jgi:hypothetical protein
MVGKDGNSFASVLQHSHQASGMIVVPVAKDYEVRLGKVNSHGVDVMRSHLGGWAAVQEQVPPLAAQVYLQS